MDRSDVRELPFNTRAVYHGTAAQLKAGDLLEPGFPSNYQEGRISNHVYFTKVVASLAAQLAAALTGTPGTRACVPGGAHRSVRG